MPSDWKTDRDALVRETMAFVASVSKDIPASHVTAPADYTSVAIERRPHQGRQSKAVRERP